MKARGVDRGDVVMTLIGNRPEWVLAMVACFRIGAVALPCNEQLRAKDLRQRLDVATAKLIVADERNAPELDAAQPACELVTIPDESLYAYDAPPPTDLDPTDPALITFTSGTTGEAKGIVHGQRYLPGQKLQATHWLDARHGDLVWCTAASGWSKSARNVFIAPWINGATALLHDARFDPHERLVIAEREQRQRPLHGPDRVPRDRQAGDARAATRSPLAGRRRGGTQPRGAARIPGRHRAGDQGRIRTDRDRPADGESRGQAGTCGLNGAPAPRSGLKSRRRRARPRGTPAPIRRSSSSISTVQRRPQRSPGIPATASSRTRTAICISRDARMT